MATNRSWYENAVAAYGKAKIDSLSSNALNDLDNTFGAISQRLESAVQGGWYNGSLLQNWLQNEMQPKLDRYVQEAARAAAEASKPVSLTLTGGTVLENSAEGTAVGTLGANSKTGALSGVKYELVSGGDAFRIVDGNKLVATKSFNFEMQSSHNVTVKATDANGQSIWQNVTVKVQDVNERPDNLQLWWNQVIENQGAGTYVGGLAATDPDRGDFVTFSVVGGKDAADFKVVNGALVTARALDYEAGATREVTVRGTDKGGLSVEKTFTVVVNDTNDRPTDILASGLTVAVGAAKGTVAATLTSVDQDAGDKGWFQIVGGRNAADYKISGDKLVTTKVLAAGTGEVTVRVYDKWGQTVDKTLQVKVGDVLPPPPANVAPTDVVLASQGIAENLAAGATVGTLSAVDTNAGETFTYRIVGGKDASLFDVAGDKLVARAPLDHEAGATREVVIQVTDKGGLTFQKAMVVNVLDVNEAPVSLALAGGSVAENAVAGTAVGALSGVDPDRGDALVFSVVGGKDAAMFKVVGGQLVTAAALDYEAGATREVTLRATDKGGLSVDKAVTIGVLDINEAPTSVNLVGDLVEENKAAGTVVGTLSGTDPDHADALSFSVVGGKDAALFKVVGGQLVTTAALDYEAAATREIVIRATDKGGLTFDRAFTVQVGDVDEANRAPTSVSLSGDEVAENMAAGTVVGTVSGVDPDDGDALTFSIVGGPDATSFALVGSQLVAVGPFDFEAGATREVMLRATDKAGATFDQLVQVRVTDVNEAPTAVYLAGSVAENAPAGTVVGRLSATDPDGAESLAYQIVGGRDAAAFALSGDQLVALVSFDHEAGATKDVLVRVTDKGGLSFEQAISVSVLDVNEAPTALGITWNGGVKASDPSGKLVGTLNPVDPDQTERFTYEVVGGKDAALFSIDESGNLFANQALGFNGGVDREVQVQVTDKGGLSVSGTYAFHVQGVAPVDVEVSATVIADRAAAGTTVAQLTSVGLDATDSVTYSIVGGPNAAEFVIQGDRVVLAADADYAQGGATRSFVLRATEMDGAYYEETLSFEVTKPVVVGGSLTGLELSDYAVSEGLPGPHVVASFVPAGAAPGTVSYEIVGGANAAMFSVDGEGRLVLNDYAWSFDTPTLDVQVKATGADGSSLVQSFSIATLPVTYISGGGYIEGYNGSADAFMPDGGVPMEVHGFDEREGDQFAMFLLLAQEDISGATVRLEGADDMNVKIMADFGLGFMEVAAVFNGVSKNGMLNGDGVADALSQQQLDSLAADWMANHVIHS